ncbi:MAG: metallophosphoesterase family protein [Eubacteriales bacterium]|nr:metallophosphoesterase family protein [Eubacteriales bacterium]
MIYLTGDTHADFRRFSTRIFPEQKNMTKEDYVIILGDFGGIWSGDPQDRTEQYWLDWFEDKSFTTLFLDGNHENYDRLDTYPVREWNGGKVQEIRPSILHLMRGQVFRLAGKSFFVFGGAGSHDIADGIFEADDPELRRLQRLKAKGHPYYQNRQYRVNHVSWWEREMPSEDEMQEGRENLEAAGWTVDYVLTHCLPGSLHLEIGDGNYKPDSLTDYLEKIRSRCRYRCWFCGHYHWDHNISEREKILYNQITRIV